MKTQFDKFTCKLLLATTIREKDDSYIVSEIFNRFTSIQELLDVTEEELLSIKGIGKVKAQQIIAAWKREVQRMLTITLKTCSI